MDLAVDLSNLSVGLESLEKTFREVYGIGCFMINTLKDVLKKIQVIEYSIEAYDRGGIVYVREKVSSDTIDFEIYLSRNKMEILYGDGKHVEIIISRTSYLLLDKYDEFIRLL